MAKINKVEKEPKYIIDLDDEEISDGNHYLKHLEVSIDGFRILAGDPLNALLFERKEEAQLIADYVGGRVEGVGRMSKILDACCGSRMFWFDKYNEDAVYMDNRTFYEKLESGHIVNVNPDVVGDFRDMSFEDNSFYLVVFDPPHLLKAGDNSWLAKKYGKLNKDTWQDDIKRGFSECMRVLKPNGTLIFKWNENQIKLKDILSTIDYKPLFGNRRSKTHWLVFMKEADQ